LHMAARLSMSRRAIVVLSQLGRALDALAALSSADRPSEITLLLERFDLLTVLYLDAVSRHGSRKVDKIERYLYEWRHIQSEITGEELLALGLPEGPLVGDLLDRLRAARLDGETVNREEELELARGEIAALKP
jgi:tRNA nucleotidyltransferase (CCA-adding enzyme)